VPGPAERDGYVYAVLRVVPSAVRGEALNVGLVLYSRRHQFLRAGTHLDPDRLAALGGVDLDALTAHLHGIERIAAGDPVGGRLAALPQSERFGWLVAPSSTIVQASPVHTGLSDDPEASFAKLFAALVLPPA
jgi:hypothetical protein